MEATFIFLLKVSGCLTVLYGAYLLLFRNDTNFKAQRFYLMASIVLSITLSLNNYALRQYKPVAAQESISAPSIEIKNQPAVNQKWKHTGTKDPSTDTFLAGEKSVASFAVLLKWSYISIAALLLLRITFGFLTLFWLCQHARCEAMFNTRIYLTGKINGSANIFGFIFLNPTLAKDPKLAQIILHEKIHASQFHSIDILLAELLAAALWFNPVVWLLRRSLQQIHEYLADDGVLSSGVNRLEYQKLLISHITEDSLVLSSGLKSSIKKRFFMMTKANVKRQTKSKMLILFPLAAILIIGMSLINPPAPEDKPTQQDPQTKVQSSQKSAVKYPKPVITKTSEQIPKPSVKFAPPVVNEKGDMPQEPPVAAVSLSKMNVFYLDVDNPLTIAVANYNPKDVKLTLTNGTITKADGGYYNYIVRPKEAGMAILSVYAGEKLINKLEYRVKSVPNPVVMVAGQKGGLISREKLLKAEKVEALVENFDFNIEFKVTEFTVSVNIGDYSQDLHSDSEKLTPKQIELFKGLRKEVRLYFSDVKCVGPDGTIRDLSPIAFKID